MTQNRPLRQGQLHGRELKFQKEEITHLKRKLKDTVKKAEFDSIQAEKNRLVIRGEQVEKQLKQKTEEFKKMEKEHIWLEKEYNAMYNNVDEEHEESLNQTAAARSSKG
jgi:predicted nuclease with TOPRIM domain